MTTKILERGFSIINDHLSRGALVISVSKGISRFVLNKTITENVKINHFHAQKGELTPKMEMEGELMQGIQNHFYASTPLLQIFR